MRGKWFSEKNALILSKKFLAIPSKIGAML